MCTDIQFLVMMLRILIDDLEHTPNQIYSDDKLIKLLSVAAKMVITEVILSEAYTVTIDFTTPTFDICPAAPDLICTLVTLKAACLTDQFSMRAQAAAEGIKAVCGPVTMQKSAGGKLLDTLMENGPCKAYADLKDKTEFKDPLASGEYFRAVMGPFISNTYRCNKCGSYSVNESRCCGY